MMGEDKKFSFGHVYFEMLSYPDDEQQAIVCDDWSFTERCETTKI